MDFSKILELELENLKVPESPEASVVLETENPLKELERIAALNDLLRSLT